MKAAGWLIVATLGATAGVACTRLARVEFSHTEHLEALECGGPDQPKCLSCASCHRVDREASIEPGSVACKQCHDDGGDVDPNQWPVAREPLYGKIQFDHREHLELPEVKGQCLQCHKGVVDDVPRAVPPMAACFECHEHKEQWDNRQCTPCHLRSDLQAIFPQTFLKHDARFLSQHGRLAKAEQQLCQQCHTPAQCEGCHDATQPLTKSQREPDAVQRTQIHRARFLDRHAIEAAARPARCLTCHSTQSCDSCHVEHGVSANRSGTRNPHPPRWLSNQPNVPSGHSAAARRDLIGCASCHDQGASTNCIRCHREGAYGGNPHPNGWRSAEPLSAQMCRYCHVP